MYMSLSPGAIGIRGLALPESIALARRSGFAGVSVALPELRELAEQRGTGAIRELFTQAGVAPASWGLPFDWGPSELWESALRSLPEFCTLATDLGCQRATLVMPSGSNERTYAENFAWHVARIQPIAEILRDHRCRLGIEYIGPETYRATFKHEFIYNLGGLMELISAIGTGNVGVLLDSYHLYTSGGTMTDLDQLSAEDVVVVHVNDAPADVPRAAQMDLVRALPMETGVIDLPTFIGKLNAMGYDGPVMPEPFSARINTLAATDPDAAAREVAASMTSLWRAAGLALSDGE